ncbi:MAG: DUF4384 domain-containing protein [Acidobacteria bacterium]|nr:DUF4384 domain-containing protein [Acidobacteriota bacterium]
MFQRISWMALLGSALVWSQDASTDNGPRLTAREIFYGAKPSAPPAPAVVTAAKKTPKPVEQARTQRPKSGGEPVEQTVPVRLAADTVSQGGGLAMRWTITQLMPDGNKKEVPTTQAFKSGDRINVRVEVNEFGYLYILARGSSGKWSPLFPSPQISGGDNRVGPNQAYTIPAGFVFKFDDQPGEERIFIVFSRKPEPDFDGLIYKVAPERNQVPAASPSAPIRPAPGIILASNSNFGDPFVDRVRTMYARDLIVEKVEGEQKSSNLGPRFEHAAYVASKRGDDPRVTAEVTLTHK